MERGKMCWINKQAHREQSGGGEWSNYELKNKLELYTNREREVRAESKKCEFNLNSCGRVNSI